MKVVCLSDTHYTDERLLALQVPEGDVLIHAGDATLMGKRGESIHFFNWFRALPHKIKIFIPGNHDFEFEEWSGVRIMPWGAIITCGFWSFDFGGQRYSVFGMSYVKELPNWAFNRDERSIGRILQATRPQAADILVTHMPPYGILDYYPALHINKDGHVIEGEEHLGSKALRHFTTQTKPRLHVFGHIHEGAGRIQKGGTTFVNAAILDGNYQVAHPVQVIELGEG